jgi:hypothetical protein
MSYAVSPEWVKKKILIAVKTYPNPSMQYQETVCTAGITDTGEWIRLYPIEFRHLPYEQQYKKYDWIEINVKRRLQDYRIESHTPDSDSINVTGCCSTKRKWLERKEIILPLAKSSLEEIKYLYETSAISLGVFKPKEVLDFYWKEDDQYWSPQHELALSKIRLFGSTPAKLEKIPWLFRYKFMCDDSNCKGHDISIIDWEIYQAYREWRWKYNSTLLMQKIKDKWLGDICSPSRDTYFIVGNKYRTKSFMVLGVFWPPK